MITIIKGNDGRIHVISKTLQVSTAVRYYLKRNGITEFAVRKSEKIPEYTAVTQFISVNK